MTNAPQAVPLDEGRPLLVARLLVVVMAVCFGFTVAEFAAWGFPGWPSGGIAVVCVLMATEAALTAWFLKERALPGIQAFAYRAGEWVILLLLLKLFSELHGGPQALWTNIRQWRQDFPIHLFNRDFVVNVLVAYATWQTCLLFTNTLLTMEKTYSEASSTVSQAISEQNQPLRVTLLRHLLVSGGFLVILGGAMLQTALLPPGRIVSGSWITTLIVVYFILGLILVGLTNFTALITFWRTNRVAVQKDLAGRWTILSIVFLVILIAAAVWLPTTYELGLLDTLGLFLRLLFGLVQLFYLVLLYLLSLANRAISSLFDNPGEPAPDISIIPPTASEVLPQVARQVTTPEFVKSLFFWAIFLGVLIFAFRQYLAANPELARALKRVGPLRWLGALWDWLKEAFQEVHQSVGGVIRRGVNRLRAGRKGSRDLRTWGYVNLRRLTPRQKVRFFYLALVRRGGETGLSRHDWQTPSEYAQTLESGIEAETDTVEAMTEAFLRARYSREEVSAVQARQSQGYWERLRRALRSWRAGKEEE
ncbi:MAG: DUF4129 domain-containing protein [Anaerolineales bacterium]|nr:DUF4129 domain-containing protein [Anaerolineales bacterium]